MAPTPLFTLTQRDAVLGGAGATDGNYTPWLIVLIIVGALVVVAVLVFVVADRMRRKQYMEASGRDPYLSQREFKRRRKLSAIERLEEEELQRSFMIRKSLATRSSRTNSQVTINITPADMESSSKERVFATAAHQHSDIEDEMEDSQAGLRDDWKAWEARMQRERSDSTERHPFVMEVHPAMGGPSSEDIGLSRPQPSRTASPSRSPLMPVRGSPTLPSLPTFAHTR